MSFASSRLLVVSCLAWFLAGCDPLAEPESLFDEYLERTARVLDGEVVATPVPTAPRVPRRRERVRTLPDLDVGMLDFLSLYGCELQHVIGERNSVLGRVLHPAGLLDYELRFVRAAEDCMGSIGSERLAARVGEVVAIKRAALPDVIWNAIWGSQEIEHLLSLSGGILPVGHDRDVAGAMAGDLQALQSAVGRILDDDLDVDIPSLDSLYQRWQARPLAGQAIRAAVLAATRLNDASSLIEARLGDRPMCARPSLRPRAAENMQGMFLSVYIGHVQPYLADLQRVRREVIAPLAALSDLGETSRTPEVAAYAARALRDDTGHGLWHAYDRAVDRHTRAWQALLEQCGMRPGQQAG